MFANAWSRSWQKRFVDSAQLDSVRLSVIHFINHICSIASRSTLQPSHRVGQRSLSCITACFFFSYFCPNLLNLQQTWWNIIFLSFPANPHILTSPRTDRDRRRLLARPLVSSPSPSNAPLPAFPVDFWADDETQSLSIPTRSRLFRPEWPSSRKRNYGRVCRRWRRRRQCRKSPRNAGKGWNRERSSRRKRMLLLTTKRWRMRGYRILSFLHFHFHLFHQRRRRCRRKDATVILLRFRQTPSRGRRMRPLKKKASAAAERKNWNRNDARSNSDSPSTRRRCT